MRRSPRREPVTLFNSWRGTCHSSRRTSLHPDEPTLSLPSRICTGVIEVTECTPNCIPKCSCAHAPSLFRQGSVGTPQRGQAARPRVRPAGLPIAPLHLHRDPLRRMSRHHRGTQHDPRAHRRSSLVQPRAAHARRRSVRGHPTRICPCRAASEVATPRQAAAGVVNHSGALARQRERDDRRPARVDRALTSAARDSKGTWKNKDAAVYLFEAVATSSGTLAQCVTATNPNVNLVQWFGDNIFGDLQAAAGGGVHPALQVDAIRYLYTFRYQFTKEQLVSVLPLLLNRLGSQEVVVYTRAAVALDCILSMRAGGSTTLMFSSADVQPFVSQPLNVLLAKIGVQQSPAAENDFLVLRVIITVKQALVGEYFIASPFCRGSSTSSLKVAPNPSNPPALVNTFSKAYPVIFDSIALLCRLDRRIRFCALILRFFRPFTGMLQKT
ncbi:Cse1 domain containing protein [Lactarius tabidus]